MRDQCISQAGRIEPILHQIEPALPCDQVANLDQPHGVVGRQGIEHAGLDGGHGKRESNRRAQQQHHDDQVCRALGRLPIRRGGMTGRVTPQPAKASGNRCAGISIGHAGLDGAGHRLLPDRRRIEDVGMRVRSGHGRAPLWLRAARPRNEAGAVATLTGISAGTVSCPPDIARRMIRVATISVAPIRPARQSR